MINGQNHILGSSYLRSGLIYFVGDDCFVGFQILVFGFWFLAFGFQFLVFDFAVDFSFLKNLNSDFRFQFSVIAFKNNKIKILLIVKCLLWKNKKEDTIIITLYKIIKNYYKTKIQEIQLICMKQ